MNIRLASPDDAQELARVHIDSWRAAYRGLVPDAHLEGMDYAQRAERFRASLTAHLEETYVAEDSSGVSGFVTLGKCRDSDVDEDSTGEIWGLYLAPEHWRNHIGTRLCKWAEAQLTSRGYSAAVLWVFADNPQARAFYEAMGFALDGATQVLKLGKALKAVRYRKQFEPDD